MASSDVDQKYLGRFARLTSETHSFLSGMLYKVLGLSVRLSRKLVKARRYRKLDTTRETKSLSLYHHIIWLSREGLVMIEQYVIPMATATSYNELKVLSFKLRASFYHIYVLFYNNPPATQAFSRVIPGPPVRMRSASDPKKNSGDRSKRSSVQDGEVEKGGGVAVRNPPPGFSHRAYPGTSANFLIPSQNYIPTAASCFREAVQVADELLYGSHPIRLSVKLEYAAFIYDCLKDGDRSRSVSKRAISDVLGAQEPLDDEMFDDSAELVKILGKMMKRGISSTPGSNSGGGSSSTPGSRVPTRHVPTTTTTTTTTIEIAPPAIPGPGMTNPI